MLKLRFKSDEYDGGRLVCARGRCIEHLRKGDLVKFDTGTIGLVYPRNLKDGRSALSEAFFTDQKSAHEFHATL